MCSGFSGNNNIIFLFQPDLLGVFLQQLPLKEGGLDALAVAVGLVPLADKTDVRRNRVQNPNKAKFDIHDRVNYAALSSNLKIDQEKRLIQMNLELDDSICSLMDYFEIFLERMLMCKRAAECLNCRFRLVANGSKLC